MEDDRVALIEIICFLGSFLLKFWVIVIFSFHEVREPHHIDPVLRGERGLTSGDRIEIKRVLDILADL